MTVYLDHNGSAPLTQPVREAIRAFIEGDVVCSDAGDAKGSTWANAGATHPDGLAAKSAIQDATALVARCLRAEPSEITWTSGGTESNNAAVLGLAMPTGKRHIVCGRHEHLSVIRPVERLERQGFPVTWIVPAPCGRVTEATLAAAIREDTGLVILMFANNETGALQPVKRATELAHAVGAVMFVDAVCGVGKLAVHVDEIGCDLLSLSGHKFHAPKGIGILYVRSGTLVEPLILGCGQQGDRRSGTENTMGAIALAAAMAFHTSPEEMEASIRKVRAQRDRLCAAIDRLFDSLPESRPVPNTAGDRLPGTLSLWFPGRSALDLQAALGAMGLSVGAQASRLSDGSVRPSHVLTAMGASRSRGVESLRISLSSSTTDEDIDGAIEAFRAVLTSPMNAAQYATLGSASRDEVHS